MLTDNHGCNAASSVTPMEVPNQLVRVDEVGQAWSDDQKSIPCF